MINSVNNKGYCVLHLHTHMDSILDSMVKPTRESRGKPCLLQEKAKEYNIPAIAITGHGNMSGVISHYKTSKEYGTKPIIGCEVYFCKDINIKDKTNKYYHLILLAKNDIGYLNLKTLCSLGYTKGFYSKPRIDLGLLKQYHEGLICMTACLAGELPRMIMKAYKDNDLEIEKDIENYIKVYKELFNDDFYLEIQSSANDDQIIVNQKMVELSNKFNVPLVVTTDVHFLNKEDFDVHNIYINISQDRDTENYKYCYLQSRDEILEILTPQIGLENTNKALDNTFLVADKCNVEIELGNPKLPHQETPSQYKNEYDWFVSEIKQGLIKRGIMNKPNKQEYLKRVKFELNVIHTKGFDGYFLILMRILKEARARGIPIGEGRGSAAGCLIAYLLDITNVDSVKYNLDFGRFLTMERTEYPDVDTDVSTSRRGELIDLVTEMFGVENVAQVATFGTLASKACIDSVGKVMNIPKDVRNEIKDKLATNGVSSLKTTAPTLYSKNKKFVDACEKIEGLNKSYGCHAGALCISGDGKPMLYYAPVMPNKDGKLMTQFEMHDVESAELVKYDMLGLTSLDYIADCLELIGSGYYDYEFDYNDQDVFDMISRGENTAVFQADSSFAERVLTGIKPHSIEELADCVAIGRSDAIQFLEPYMEAKFKGVKPKEIHPELTKILDMANGCLIYQEQIMRIFKVFGGFSDGEADKVRKIIGKKQLDLLPEQLDKFKTQSLKNGLSQEVINKLVEFIESNISYSFNSSHAVSYGITAYKTAYLKYHYPVEYITAVINNQKKDNGSADFDSVLNYIKIARERMDINVVGIDINHSGYKFTCNAQTKTIYYGLDLVKGLSKDAIKLIMDNRPFTSYKDFINKLGLTMDKGSVITLIKAGAFNGLVKDDKIRLLKYYYSIRFDNKKEDKKPISTVNKNHIKELLDNGYITPEQTSDKELCVKTINTSRKTQGWINFQQDHCQGTELDWERETLNAFLSGDPFDGVILPDWSIVPRDGYGYIGGIIVNVSETTVKNGKSKGQKMCFVNLSYNRQKYDIVVFSKLYLQYKPILKIGSCVVLNVKKGDNDFTGVLQGCMTLSDYLAKTAPMQTKKIKEDK